MTLLPQHGRPFRVGDQLGPSWSNHWVKVDMDFPPELRKVEQEVFCELTDSWLSKPNFADLHQSNSILPPKLSFSHLMEFPCTVSCMLTPLLATY